MLVVYLALCLVLLACTTRLFAYVTADSDVVFIANFSVNSSDMTSLLIIFYSEEVIFLHSRDHHVQRIETDIFTFLEERNWG